METSRGTDIPLLATQISFRLLARNWEVGEEVGDADKFVSSSGLEDDGKSRLVEVGCEGAVDLQRGVPGGLAAGGGDPVEVVREVGG